MIHKRSSYQNISPLSTELDKSTNDSIYYLYPYQGGMGKYDE